MKNFSNCCSRQEENGKCEIQLHFSIDNDRAGKVYTPTVIPVMVLWFTVIMKLISIGPPAVD